jgi:hypothetical protein
MYKLIVFLMSRSGATADNKNRGQDDKIEDRTTKTEDRTTGQDDEIEDRTTKTEDRMTKTEDWTTKSRTGP